MLDLHAPGHTDVTITCGSLRRPNASAAKGSETYIANNSDFAFRNKRSQSLPSRGFALTDCNILPPKLAGQGQSLARSHLWASNITQQSGIGLTYITAIEAVDFERSNKPRSAVAKMLIGKTDSYPSTLAT